MAIRDSMTTRFTLYPRTARITQVVQEIQSGKTDFYIALQEHAEFTVTTLPLVKRTLSAYADNFGNATLDLTLADVNELWHPQVPLAPDGDEDAALGAFHPGEALPVIERGNLVGILTRPTRAIGSSGLSSLYGPRFALFGDEASHAGTPAPPTRSCPNCGKTIEFFKPKRANGNIERHCPFCDWLFPAEQP